MLSGSYGVAPWKMFAKESVQLKKGCVFELGDGEKIKFGVGDCLYAKPS